MLFYFRVALNPIIYLHPRKNARKIYTHTINYAVSKNKEKVHTRTNKQKILNHLNTAFFKNESEKLNDKLFLSGLKLHFLYLMNEEVAKMIIDSVGNELQEGNKCIIEANPGFGFITRHLISLNCGKVKVFEPDTYFHNFMTQFALQHPDKLDVYAKNLNFLFSHGFREKKNQRIYLEDIIDPTEPKDWSDDYPIKIIGSCPNGLFLNQYINSIIFQQGFFLLGRPQLFLLLDSKTYSLLSPQNNIMKTFPILLKIFFDIDYVLSVDKRDFLPWFDIKLKKAKKNIIISDIDQLILVKITGRKNSFERIGGSQNLKSLWFFLTQLCKASKTRVIPSIEKWVPGLGYRLLLSGIDTFTEINDLDTEKVLDLFLTFSSWPEIHNSPYFSAMESYIGKKFSGNISDNEEESSLEEDESVS
nr:dimethyladenosine transferase 2, mitochondrial [Halyomorpha halys]